MKINAERKDTLTNLENIVAFVGIEDFKGQTTTIDLNYMRKLTEALNALADMGFDNIEIGVEDNYPLLVFLDKKKTVALAVAPRIEKED